MMLYEAWRCTFQSSEQAAWSAFSQIQRLRSLDADVVSLCRLEVELADLRNMLSINVCPAEYNNHLPALRAIAQLAGECVDLIQPQPKPEQEST